MLLVEDICQLGREDSISCAKTISGYKFRTVMKAIIPQTHIRLLCKGLKRSKDRLKTIKSRRVYSSWILRVCVRACVRV